MERNPMNKFLVSAGLMMLMGLTGAVDAFAADYRPAVAAHRGACGYLPEHTLEAKAMAYAMNPDYIEQDVVMTKDNQLVVMHDYTLDSNTDVAKKFPNRARANGRYYAVDFTLEEIKSLIVTERFNHKTGKPAFANRFPVDTGIDFRVPTLREELELVKGLNKSTGKNIGVYVEVKQPAFYKEEGKDIVAATIKMPFWKALLSALLGVMIAGAIVTLICFGGVSWLNFLV